MRFGVQLPNYGPIAGPDSLARVARLAEDLGFDSVWINDHVLVPSRITRYQRIFEAMSTLVWVAAKTERVRIGTSVLILPQRNAILAAKQLATVDVLSGGRLIVGIGAGYVEEEFRFLGAPYARRGARLEEQIAAMRALWGGADSFAGETISFEDASFGPTPLQGAEVPLWLAGASRPALRRAARLGDGWHPAHLPPEALAAKASELRELAEGRPVAVTMKIRIFIDGDGAEAASDELPGEAELRGGVEAMCDSLERYREAGLEELVLTFRHQDVDVMTREMRTFAEEIAPRFA